MRFLVFVVLFITPASLVAQDSWTVRYSSGWVGGVAFSPDSKFLASAGADRIVRVVDLAKSGIRALDGVKTYKGHTDHIAAIAFSPDGKLLATGSYDHTARLTDVTNGSSVELKGHRGAVLTVAFSPDGKQLATGSIDATVIFWDVATAMPIQTLKDHKSWVNAVAFHKNGLFATGSSDNTVKLWSSKDTTLTESSSFEFPEGEVRSLAFTPDGKALAVGVRYGFFKTIDVPSKKVTTHKAHTADVWAVAFSPDGKTLATGDGDWDRPGDVRLWDTATWKEKRTIKTNGEVLSLAFSPDGHWLSAGCWDGSVHSWRQK